MQSNDRTYHFISDPTHKENLSGRVTAACLNCRKKKIKCSGEASCKQCLEKGIVCEGPPSRKRPRKGNTSPHSTSRSVGGTDSSITSSTTFSNRQRTPPSALDVEDHGYSSLRRPSHLTQSSDWDQGGIAQHDNSTAEGVLQEVQRDYETIPRTSDITSPTRAQFTFSADYNTRDGALDPSHRAMPTEWGFAQPSHRRRSNVNSYSNTFTSTNSISSRAKSTTSTKRPMRAEAPDVQTTTTSIGMWPVPRIASVPQNCLLDAAMTLEEEARTLRQLALQEFDHVAEESQRSQQDLFASPRLSDHPQHLQNFDLAACFHADGTMRDDVATVVGLRVADCWNAPQTEELAHDHTLENTIPDTSLTRITSHSSADIPDGGDEKSPRSASEKALGRMQRAFLNQLAPDA